MRWFKDRLGFVALSVVVAISVWPQIVSAYQSHFLPSSSKAVGAGVEISRQFPICGSSVRRNCVIDGDTFYLDGAKIRLADINTPEIGEPACSRERELGGAAARRLVSLLNAGPFVVRAGDRDSDVYGRRLRTIHRDGRSIGEVLVAEGLAHKWQGFKESWCS